ncbi:MAG: outer membrane lipoprotein chaperone LolA [Motiliproteus sp.]|nr:outer membrane lipoprotein chaperone LolA [Motiliproteus sp.]MCW9053137.1 outer membrane lipoprotein chaperone LolA [Motiliproteus sp.]
MRQLVLSLLLLGFSSYSFANNTATENLHRLLSTLNSFSADFEQLVLDSSGSRLQASHGHVDLRRPGLFRWQTNEPFPQLLVSDGETLWLYDEDLEQVTQQSVDRRLTNTPALLLSGDLSDLQKSFVISGPVIGDEGVYRLTPIDENAMFAVMRIMFTEGQPVEMQLEDNLGQQTSVVFSNRLFNPMLDPDLFTFEIPEDADVIVE